MRRRKSPRSYDYATDGIRTIRLAKGEPVPTGWRKLEYLRRMINDGVNSKYIRWYEPLPEGWSYGPAPEWRNYMIRHMEEMRESRPYKKGYHYWYNGRVWKSSPFWPGPGFYLSHPNLAMVHEARKRAVKAFRADGTYVDTFESLSAAARALGCLQPSVARVAKGAKDSTGGYRFEYVDDASLAAARDAAAARRKKRGTTAKRCRVYMADGTPIGEYGSLLQACRENKVNYYLACRVACGKLI